MEPQSQLRYEQLEAGHWYEIASVEEDFDKFV